MTSLAETLRTRDADARRHRIVATLVDAFAGLMTADPAAFRTKFRKMAADPFAFYRGSTCLFYADIAELAHSSSAGSSAVESWGVDPWADQRTRRVWIQGDLHAQNFGTYLNSEGVLVFDVNDFDEAYLGHFTWDLQRFAASLALLGWAKALSDTDIDALVATYLRAYLDQVRQFLDADDDSDFSLHLDTAYGAVRDVLLKTRLSTRVGLLDRITETRGYDRIFRDGSGVRRLAAAERAEVCAAFECYLDTIPRSKKFRRIAYAVKDVIGRSGFGIGSAGLPAYSLLIEGYNQALDNDIVLSMKQGNVAAPSRVVTDPELAGYFRHHGHRTAISQRALQAHADPLLGYTELGGVGYVVSEVSPYQADLDWSELTEPTDIGPVVDQLGRATAKVHCVSDSDSDHSLVPFQTEEAIAAVIGDRDDELVAWVTRFGREYGAVARDDHRLFVDAFRNGEIPGVRSTAHGV